MDMEDVCESNAIENINKLLHILCTGERDWARAPVYSADILNIYPKFYFQQIDLKPTNQVYDRSDFSLFLFFVPLQATKQLMRSTNR